MSITLYSKYRRQGLRKAWEFSGMTQTVVHGATVALAALIVLAVLGMIDDYNEAHASVAASQEQARNVELAFVSCLNHKGLYINGEVVVCELGRTGVMK